MKRRFTIVGLLLLVIGALMACGASNNTGTAAQVSSPAKAAATPTKPVVAKHFTVGETVKVGDTWQVVVKSVTDNAGSTYQKPTKGTFMEVTVQLTNISNAEQTISSAVNFTLRDSNGQEYTETIAMDDSGNANTPPDGKVEAGQPIQGVFAYDVPVKTKFTLAFAPDMLSSGQTIWDINS
jgi:Domain of unknown function (DUF4352)